MMQPEIQDAFNKQLNAEFFSSYLYFSMEAYFHSLNLNGVAHWMRMQAEEEHAHAMKFFDFINDRGGSVLLGQIDAPPTEWDSPLAAIEDVYRHECAISGSINELADLAIARKDHASNAFLQWFVTEQVEEESSAQEIRDKLKLAGDGGAALFMIDHELGQRSAAGLGTG